jgi:hypothetical protein
MVTVRSVRVHGSMLMLSLFVVLRCLLVLICREFVMLGSLLVVLGTRMLSHRSPDDVVVTPFRRPSGVPVALSLEFDQESRLLQVERE